MTFSVKDFKNCVEHRCYRTLRERDVERERKRERENEN